MNRRNNIMWERVLKHLKSEIKPQPFQLWLAPTYQMWEEVEAEEEFNATYNPNNESDSD